MVRSPLIIIFLFVSSSSLARLSSPRSSQILYLLSQHTTQHISILSHSHTLTFSLPLYQHRSAQTLIHPYVSFHTLQQPPTTSLTHLHFHRRRRSPPLRTIQTRRKRPRVLQIPPRKRQRAARLQPRPSRLC